jgi:ferric-dicitrate binding protein FerR (iron transport regulator)
MSEELFERYLQNDLDEAGARELSAVLATEEGARDFSEFVQEWTLLGEAARQRVAEAGRPGTQKIRKRAPAPEPSRTWIGWAVGLAAAAAFMIALAIPGRLPSREEKPAPRITQVPPVRVDEPRPAPPEPGRPAPPRPEPERAIPPVPPPSVGPATAPPAAPPSVEPAREKIPETRPAPPEKVARPVIAVLGRVQGDVQIASAAGKRKAAAGEGLTADDGLESAGSASHAVLDYPDGTRIELGPDSTIERHAERQGKRIITLARGTVAATVAKQAPGRSVGLTTPHAEVTVLGTQFTLVVTADATRLEVREGRVRLTRLPDGASIEVAAGHHSVAARGQKLESKPVLFTREFQDGPGYSGTRDTQISGAEPARAFGSADYVESDGDEVDGKKIHALLKWDLSELPPGAVVRSAVITLNIVNESLGTGYSFFEMKRSWSETEATWRQAAAGQPWRAAGARSPADRGSELLGAVAPRKKGEVPMLLTPAGEAAIQSWIRTPASNHGFIIVNDTNVDGFKFSSRESMPPERRPKLTITYTLAAK